MIAVFSFATFALAGRWFKGSLRIVCVNLALFGAIIAGLEFALSDLHLFPQTRIASLARTDGTYTKSYFQNKGVLGYGPRDGGVKIDSTKFDDQGKQVYSVVYTTDSNNARHTPDIPKQKSGQATALFFGCSFTFGEGVNDDETFSAVFQQATKIKAYNFAFHGYGPHQMLRRLETDDKMQDLSGKNIRHAFYLALPYHIERSGGFASWDTHGPKYIWDDSAKALRYAGPFYTPEQLKRREELTHFSAMIAWFWKHWPDYAKNISYIKERDEKVFYEIIDRSRQLLREKYHSDLTVLLWWPKSEGGDAAKAQFAKRGFDVLTMQEIFPDFDSNEVNYTIPGDGYLENGKTFAHAHPNVAAHRAIGLALAQRYGQIKSPTGGLDNASHQ
jgi:hypothetical protein